MVAILSMPQCIMKALPLTFWLNINHVIHCICFIALALKYDICCTWFLAHPLNTEFYCNCFIVIQFRWQYCPKKHSFYAPIIFHYSHPWPTHMCVCMYVCIDIHPNSKTSNHVIILILMVQSGHVFAHAMTAQFPILPWFWFLWYNQITILHMSWQLNCHDMCKIVTWSNHDFTNKIEIYFYKIQIVNWYC